ncbi:MAG: YbjN domain-containing protein [Planctomycetes bacterium]|nr:YbjN domain-containing protein [Planctomycetota bacterium]
MALTMDQLRALFDKEGLRYFVDPQGPRMMFGVGGLNGPFQIMVALDLEGRFLQIRTLNYHFCPASHANLLAVLRTMTTINYTTRFIKFAWDANDGEVVAYADTWIMDGTLTQEQIHRILGNFIPVIDLAIARIRQAMETGEDPGEMTPEKAFAARLSDPNLPEPLRKMLEKLKEGAAKKPPEKPAEPPPGTKPDAPAGDAPKIEEI